MLAILKEYLYVFFCAMVPLIELRGSVLIGAGMGMPWFAEYREKFTEMTLMVLVRKSIEILRLFWLPIL